MKKIKSLSILIIAAMLLALICPITSNAATTIQFEDSELAGQVQKFLGDKATISGSTVTSFVKLQKFKRVRNFYAKSF